MIFIWQKYKRLVKRNCTDPNLADTELAYWRNQLFAATVLFIVPLSVIAIIPGVYMAITTEFYLLLFADFVVVLSLGFIAFSSILTLNFRKKLLCGSLYFVTIVLLYELGSFGPGLLYLLALTVFISLIFEFKYGVISLIINSTVCALFALFIYYDYGRSPIVSQYGLDSWIAVSSNLIFLSAVSVVLIPRLFDGLQSAFKKRTEAEIELNKSKKELEESLALLEEKSKELEQFAYAASHDLKEPLRMIQGFLTLLEKRYQEKLDNRARKYIHFSVDGAKRLGTLIDDLLEYSRVGRIHTNIEDIDLNEMLNELIKNEIAHSGDSTEIIQFNNLPVINAVPVSINMLFRNLISNALKYQDGKKDPEIKITSMEDQNHWNFSVIDNGIGIEKKFFDKIFMLFNRLHTKEEYPGTGMGLAICKKIVEEHGGKIWVESEVNKGSVFKFTLPKTRR
jgi:signal transduction histidine kinase